MSLPKIIIYGLIIVFVLWVLAHIDPKIDARDARREADLIIITGSGTAKVIDKIISKFQEMGRDTSKELPEADKIRLDKLRAIRDAR